MFVKTEIFEDLGISATESKVYVALLELGPSRAGEVMRLTQLRNSVVHLTLSRLVDKGLASFVRRGRVRNYTATDPRQLLRWVDEKKARYELALPELLAIQTIKERQEAEVFEGLPGLKAMCYQFIEDAEPGDEYLVFAFTTAIEHRDREIYSFYREFTRDRIRRGIKIQGIAPESRRSLFQELDWDLGEWIFVKFPVIQNISVFRNRIIMTPWEYHPVSYLISSKQIADMFRAYFKMIWSSSKA